MFLTDKFMSEAREDAVRYWKDYSSDNLYEVVKNHISRGNKKLGKDIIIFNSGTAHDCPSVKLGYCQAGKACYALKTEKQYTSSYPYRCRQALLWKYISAEDFAMSIVKYRNQSRSEITSFRYNEAGDFESQQHVNWFTYVCKILSKYGIACYGYTARADLNINILAKYSQVNVSNDKFNTKVNINRFKMMVELSNDIEHTCKCSNGTASSCSECNLCKEHSGIIQVLKH